MTNVDALRRQRSIRRCTIFLSSFIFGMPYISRPPIAIGALVHCDRMAGPVQLRCAGEPGRAGADNRDLFAGSSLRRSGGDPPLRKSVINDGALDSS